VPEIRPGVNQFGQDLLKIRDFWGQVNYLKFAPDFWGQVNYLKFAPAKDFWGQVNYLKFAPAKKCSKFMGTNSQEIHRDRLSIEKSPVNRTFRTKFTGTGYLLRNRRSIALSALIRFAPPSQLHVD
jgi:hypothetical protein